MSVITELDLSFNDQTLQDFLLSGKATFSRGITPPHHFFPAGTRQHVFPSVSKSVDFLVREVYSVEQSGVFIGNVSVVVLLSCNLEISVEHVLFLKEGLSKDKITKAKDQINKYKLSDGDFKDWLRDQIKDKWIEEDEFSVAGVVHLKKTNPTEKNTTQRDALFQLYGVVSPPLRSKIHVLPEGQTFDSWAKNRNSSLRLVYKESAQGNEPDKKLDIREVHPKATPGAAADGAIMNILEDIANKTARSECAKTIHQEKKILTVNGWPEFKIEWELKTIRMGCIDIKLHMPILYARVSALILYLRYEIPLTADATLKAILESCALRATLNPGVIALALVNIVAAIGAFITAFISCVGKELAECLNPGLVLVKETPDWKPL